MTTYVDDTLSSAIESSLAALTGSHRQLLAVLAKRERPVSLVTSGVADANGNALLVFDAVGQGETWDLYRLVVGGVTWATVAAGTAVVYKTSNAATTGPSLFSVFDEASSLPSVAFYLQNQVPVVAGEKVVVYVAGATAGQQYLAAAHFVITT